MLIHAIKKATDIDKNELTETIFISEVPSLSLTIDMF